jgi:hypothetical protein
MTPLPRLAHFAERSRKFSKSSGLSEMTSTWFFAKTIPTHPIAGNSVICDFPVSYKSISPANKFPRDNMARLRGTNGKNDACPATTAGMYRAGVSGAGCRERQIAEFLPPFFRQSGERSFPEGPMHLQHGGEVPEQLILLCGGKMSRAAGQRL